MSSIAELRNVTKTFNGITALDDVNLRIRDGEILALLGPSGSGKTTLLKILAFIDRPSKGEVYFYGRKVTDEIVQQMRMESTMVFQKSILFNTSVYNNIAYGLRIRKMSKSMVDKEVNKALGLVGLEGFEKRQAKDLSGGEQQRVALARALVLNTKFILLDEPTANLDPKNASAIEEIIATINRDLKITIVMATHNMYQARSLPHRIALMSEGKIKEVGTPTEIFGSLSKTLASFAVLENTFTGNAKPTENDTTLVDVGNNVQIETTVQSYGKVSIFIRPEDIVASKRRLKSSARNTFGGKITEISDLGSVIRLKVEAGKVFTVQITKKSFQEMELNVGSKVFIAFKSSSVYLI